MNEEIKNICKEAAAALLQALRVSGMPDGYRPEIYDKLMSVVNDEIDSKALFFKFIIEKQDGGKVRFFVDFDNALKLVRQIDAFYITHLQFEHYSDENTKYRVLINKNDIKNYDLQISGGTENIK